ncbi:hypothetical protein [Streptomyces sp. NPDC057438]|uniref:hypothetical protein n=1 Tax=Streptomyces sp. NPDC057438 TaxID=3346133 RepID=UPI0036834703
MPAASRAPRAARQGPSLAEVSLNSRAVARPAFSSQGDGELLRLAAGAVYPAAAESCPARWMSYGR